MLPTETAAQEHLLTPLPCVRYCDYVIYGSEPRTEDCLDIVLFSSWWSTQECEEWRQIFVR